MIPPFQKHICAAFLVRIQVLQIGRKNISGSWLWQSPTLLWEIWLHRQSGNTWKRNHHWLVPMVKWVVTAAKTMTTTHLPWAQNPWHGAQGRVLSLACEIHSSTGAPRHRLLSNARNRLGLEKNIWYFSLIYVVYWGKKKDRKNLIYILLYLASINPYIISWGDWPMLLHRSVVCFYWLVVFIVWIFHHLFIHPPFGKHLGCFASDHCVNRWTMNTCVQVFVDTYFHLSWVNAKEWTYCIKG